MRLRIAFIGAVFALAASTLGSASAEAQVYDGGTTTTIGGSNPVFYTMGYDTLENAGYLIDTFKITEYQYSVLFFLYSGKISGNHGGTWKILGSPVKEGPYAPITSINIANGDSTYSHVITGNPYTYYKTIVQDTSATQESRYKTYIQVRKPPR